VTVKVSDRGFEIAEKLKNRENEIHTCGKNRWVNRWEELMGQQREEPMSLLYSPASSTEREEDETKDRERQKKKETSKNSSNLMLRIETTIKDSRVFCSSALLRD